MSLPAGHRFGRYRLVRLLGSGGMGEVYFAEDTQLGRPVALKVLPAEVAPTRAQAARLLREARAASAISHPNVAHVYEIGEEGGRPFIAMEYVEGRSLDAGEAPLPPERVLAIAVQLADALAEAHARGVVHRDLKPANVLVDSSGRVKVLDFGIAKLQPAGPASAEDETQLRTATGAVMGTVAYMSPEQLEGRAVDAKSDLWSLGVVLYELASGRHPFKGWTPAMTIANVLKVEPEPLGQLAPALPPAFGAAVDRCLEKDAQRRFASAQELRDELATMLVSPYSGASPARRRQRPALPWRRAVVASLVVALLAAGALALRQWRRGDDAADAAPGPSATQVRSLAVLPFTNRSRASDGAMVADAVSEGLVDKLSALRDLEVIATSSVARYRGATFDPLAAARELGVDAVVAGEVADGDGALRVRAELVAAGSGRRLWGGRYQHASGALLVLPQRIGVELGETVRPALSRAERQRLGKRHTEDAEAQRLYLMGRWFWNRATREGNERAADLFRQAIARDPGYALAHAGLADSYALVLADWYRPPREWTPRAVAAAEQALRLDPELAAAHTLLAFTSVYYDWDWEEGERRIRRAIALEPSYALAHHQYGWFLIYMGRYEEARRELERALVLDPLSLVIANDLNAPYALTGRFDEARARCRAVLEMDERFFLPHFALGWMEALRGDAAAGVRWLERARQLDDSPMNVAWLGYARAQAGDRAGAAAALADLAARRQRGYVPAFHFALLHLGLEEREESLVELERAVEERDGWLVWLDVLPPLAPLRAEPRFVALREAMHVRR
jgi:serine/threonine-protein kinase